MSMKSSQYDAGVVGAEGHHVRSVMHRIEAFVEAWGGVEVIDTVFTLHESEG